MPPTVSPGSPSDSAAADVPSLEFAARVVGAVRGVAAAEILPRFRSASARRKADGSLVTEADLAAQRALAEALSRVAPVAFLGEEMAEAAQRQAWETGGRFWCVDPIDGTANFSAGIPCFGVSVALMQAGRPLLGVVYDPAADEAFVALRGAGAWLDGVRLVRPGHDIPFSGARAEVDLRRSHARLRHALRQNPPFARRYRSGSSALSWCHLAAGRRDLLLHAGQKVWDYAAGTLIAAEAGAPFATLESDDFWSGTAWQRSVIAARTPALFAAWRDWIRTAL